MFVSKLDVVNSCLATMGETPLNTLEEDHTYKAAALLYLNSSNLSEQKRGYWFNSEYIWLQPDATSGYIYVPQDAVSVKPIRNSTPRISQRGRRLYDPVNNTYVWTSQVPVDVVRLLTFEDLPFHAAEVVSLGAVGRFQQRFDGDNVRYQEISEEYSAARRELRAEEIRNVRPNLLYSASNQMNMQQIGPYTQVGPYLPYR